MRKTILATAGVAMLTLCAAEAGAHEGIGGEPGHWDMQNGVKVWHTHGPTPEERAAHRKRNCEAAQAKMQRKADAWNRGEAAAWARLQETCGDKSPVGQAGCKNRRRMYQANYSAAAAADFKKFLLGKIAEACGPPKSREEVRCEQLARAIERARSRRNAKGTAYWMQQATEAGCV